jgi:tripartite-type tricarboxylate transporter receptor subunit TctC
MSDYLGKILGGIDVVVKNVAGGSSASAVAEVATAPANGTVFYATTPTYIFTSLMADLSYEYDDLAPVANYFSDPQVLYTRGDAPFDTLQDVLNHAREDGRSAWGAGNPGSLERITLERLKRLTGVNAAVVTTEGGGDTMLGVLNGTLDMAQGELQELLPQIQAGELKLLAVLTEERLENYPDLPTVKETGIDLVVTKFRGLASPEGLPEDIIATWEKAIQRLLDHPEFKEWYSKRGLNPTFIPHEEYVQFIRNFADDKHEFLLEVGVIQE